MGNNNSEKQPKKILPFWPHYILSETIAWYIMFGILIILATVFPVGLEDKADAFKTPEHVKPEWYFLAVYQFLKVASVFSFLGAEAPKLLGILLPAFGGALLFVLPFLDRAPKRVWRHRPMMIAVVAVVLIVMGVLTYWGTL
jgi:quinol-cytochrome oxidoreductase complex cytochrome b subunit